MIFRSITSIALTAVSAMMISAGPVFAGDDDDYVNLKTRKLNGPRLGMTYVAQGDFLDRNGGLNKALKENEIGQVISLFGWHFEWLVTPEGGGPSFVTQLVPFIGGVEYATLIPSGTLVLGIRFPKGFEFGLGPNLLVRIRGSSPVSSALLVAIGKSIDFSGVSIPLNLAICTNNEGTRVSFVFGYALGRKA